MQTTQQPSTTMAGVEDIKTGEAAVSQSDSHVDVDSDGEDENMEICVVDDKPDPLYTPAPRPLASPAPSSPLSTGELLILITTVIK